MQVVSVMLWLMPAMVKQVLVSAEFKGQLGTAVKSKHLLLTFYSITCIQSFYCIHLYNLFAH